MCCKYKFLANKWIIIVLISRTEYCLAAIVILGSAIIEKGGYMENG
jgi:hypothetical protein